MTDSSGFGSSLNLIRNLVQTRQDVTRQKLDAEIQRISQELQQELQNAVRPVKVRGEVTQATPNPNTGQTAVVVQTPQGEVEIALPPEQAPPPKTVLEIEIPPRPESSPNQAAQTPTPEPQQTRIQIVTTPPQSNTPQTNTTQASAPQPNAPQTSIENLAQPEIQPAQTAQPRQTETPVDVRIQQTTEGAARTSLTQSQTQPQQILPPVLTSEQQALPTRLPPPEAVIRLLPVSTTEISNLLALQSTNLAQQTSPLQTQFITPQNISAVALPGPQPSPAQPQSLIPALQSSIAAVNQTLQTGAALDTVLEQNAVTPLQSFLSGLTPTLSQNISETLQSVQNFLATRFPQPVQQFFTTQTTAAPSQTTLVSPARTSTLPALPPLTNQPLQSLLTATPLEATRVAQFKPKPIDVKILSVEGPRIELTIPGTDTIQNLQTGGPAKPDAQNIITNNTPTTVTGTIIGATAENLPILSVFLGTDISANYIIQTPVQNITPGTTVTLTPQTTQTAAPEQAVPFAPLLPSLILTPGTTWPVMEEIYQTLTQTAAPTAQAFSNVMPNAASPQQITPAAMFFIAALRGGDLSGWLGDKTIDILRNTGKGNLLSRLSQEGGLLNRLSADAPAQEWRSLALPMMHHNEIQKIALHYRHENHDDDDTPEKGKTTRFIFDLALSRMGKIQVDGLFRPGRLDIVVRSDEHFSQAMQADMKRKYTSALGHSNFEGELTFQGQLDGWVTINIENEQTLGLSA